MSSLELIKKNNPELVLEKKIEIKEVKEPLNEIDLLLKEARAILEKLDSIEKAEKIELDIYDLGECNVFD